MKFVVPKSLAALTGDLSCIGKEAIKITGYLKFSLPEASESIIQAYRAGVIPCDLPKTFAAFVFTGAKTGEKNSTVG
jgi:hypothetical protein